MVQSPRDKLTRYSMSLAILAIFTTFTFPVFMPCIFGSVALILAILSKGEREFFSSRGKAAATVATAAILINIGLLVTSAFYFYRVLHEPELQEQFSQLLYQTYGISFEELMNQLGINYTGAL